MDSVAQLLSNGGAGRVRWEIALSKRLTNPLFLEQYGYRVYSQTDEDGIIQEIFARVGVTNKCFVEFGVEDGRESNTHYLLLNGWSGLWLEGSETQVTRIARLFREPIQRSQLLVTQAFITRDNINDLLIKSDMPKEIDLLSIDIDGNDWHVWNAISASAPRVVIIEYNAKLPPDCEWVMQYEEDYIWNQSDRHGASLKSLELLGAQKGYQLVGTCIGGTNAFFVRSDLAFEKFPLPATSENLYNPLRHHLFQMQTTHPSKGYLKNSYSRDERLEELFYNFVIEKGETVPTFIAVEGFHNAEYVNGQFSIQWMSAYKSSLYIDTHRSSVQCCVIYVFYGAEELQGTNIEVRVNDSVVLEDEITISGGCLEFTITNTNRYARVDFTISRLWCPARFFETQDTRQLGLGIKSVSLTSI